MNIETAFNLPVQTQLWVGSAVFVASFIRGYSGFGFSAIFLICLLPLFPISQLVPLSIVLEIIASSSQAPRIMRDINQRFLAILLGAGLLGAPIGILMLSVFSETSLRFTVYSVTLLSTSAVLLLKKRSLPAQPINLFLAGIIAGLVNGATALSGLVLALFFSSSTVGAKTMRATMISYLFFTDVITAGMLWIAGYFDMQTLTCVLLLLPFMFSGMLLGSRYFFKTPTKTFKTTVMWLLLVFCTGSIIQIILSL
jgi:uncharacterized protein